MFNEMYDFKRAMERGIYSFEFYKNYYIEKDINMIKSIYRIDTAKLFLSTRGYSKLAEEEISSFKAYNDKPERIENLASYELESFYEFLVEVGDYELAKDEYYKKVKNFFLNIRTFYDELK